MPNAQLRLPTLEDIAAARANIKARAIRTPLLKLNVAVQDIWPLVRQTVDQAVCASFLQIVETVRLLAARHHVIAEAAGAASLAVALAGLAGKGDIACIVSGGNIDPSKLGDILNGRNPFQEGWGHRGKSHHGRNPLPQKER